MLSHGLLHQRLTVKPAVMSDQRIFMTLSISVGSVRSVVSFSAAADTAATAADRLESGGFIYAGYLCNQRQNSPHVNDLTNVSAALQGPERQTDATRLIWVLWFGP